jgi:hypothetical protein
MTSVCLAAMFKNEAHIMKEFIEHYLNQGIDKFYMIDNGSDDDYLKELDYYINNNIVSLIIDNTRYAQSYLYNKHFLNVVKKHDWVILCDLDEFIYARNNFSTIKEYLNTLDESISQVLIPWKMFGSNGFNTIEKEQPKSVVKSFTKRINYNKDDNFQGVIKDNNNKYSLNKSIVRSKYLIEFVTHSHKTSSGKYITSDNRMDNVYHNSCFSKIDENILSNSNLHLNHYAIQSFSWFMKIKATRGDVVSEGNNNIRDKKYFDDYDNSSNDIDDFELCNISKFDC